MQWSAVQYSKFEDERNRPIKDLLAQLPDRMVGRAADIGCGPGNSTELLLQCFPRAEVVGIDSSADMIQAARERLPGINFHVADIALWRDQGLFDLILANASLQWVPDHASLLPALIALLGPGGSLAVQIPDNFNEPAHCLMREIAAEGPLAAKLLEAPRSMNSRQDANWYYTLLRDHELTVNIWRTTYYHPLTGGIRDIVEWLKGTGLRPFLAPLEEVERTEFLARYEAALGQAYPVFADGSVLLPFPRLFFVATR